MIEAIRIVALVGLMICGAFVLRAVNAYARRAECERCATERPAPATSTHAATHTAAHSKGNR